MFVPFIIVSRLAVVSLNFSFRRDILFDVEAFEACLQFFMPLLKKNDEVVERIFPLRIEFASIIVQEFYGCKLKTFLWEINSDFES